MYLYFNIVEMFETLFEQQGWRVETLSSTHIRYHKGEYQFEVKDNGPYIYVTIPLVNSGSRYTTRFDTYYLAEDYLYFHIDHLEKIEMDFSEKDNTSP